jgi:hypothetical protein
VHDVSHVPAVLYVKKAPYHFHGDPYAALTATYTLHIHFFNPSLTLQLCCDLHEFQTCMCIILTISFSYLSTHVFLQLQLHSPVFHILSYQPTNGIARFFNPSVSNNSDRPWQKLWTLKNYHYLLDFLLFVSVIWNLWGAENLFLFKIFILCLLGVFCPGRPYHLPRPSYAPPNNEEQLLPKTRNGTPQNFAKRKVDA